MMMALIGEISAWAGFAIRSAALSKSAGNNYKQAASRELE